MSDVRSGATTVLVICREGKSRQRYLTELDIPGVLLVLVQTLTQFFHCEIYCPISGILVDMPTYMQSSEEEKRLLTELVGLFPSLRIRCQESSGEIRTLPFGAAYRANISPALFVQEYCTPFAQRRIRTSERTQSNLPVLLNTSDQAEDFSWVRSVTANISAGGCFLISFEPLTAGDRIWLTFPDLQDAAPVPAEVRWVRLWNEHRSLPGMGVRFIDLTESQKAELGNLCGEDFMQKDR